LIVSFEHLSSSVNLSTCDFVISDSLLYSMIFFSFSFRNSSILASFSVIFKFFSVISVYITSNFYKNSFSIRIMFELALLSFSLSSCSNFSILSFEVIFSWFNWSYASWMSTFYFSIILSCMLDTFSVMTDFSSLSLVMFSKLLMKNSYRLCSDGSSCWARLRNSSLICWSTSHSWLLSLDLMD